MLHRMISRNSKYKPNIKNVETTLLVTPMFYKATNTCQFQSQTFKNNILETSYV